MGVRVSFALACLTAMLALPVSMRADNLVLNGNFSTGDFSNWQQTLTSADNTGLNVFNDSNLGIYFAGFGAVNGVLGDISTYDGISQTLNTIAGSQYTLSFSMMNEAITPPAPPCDGNCSSSSDVALFTPNAGASTNYDFVVFWDGLDVPLDEINPGNGAWTTYSYTVTATGNDQLSFYGFNTPASDDLTNVDVEATPEPSSFLLLGTGLLGMALALRQRLA